MQNASTAKSTNFGLADFKILFSIVALFLAASQAKALPSIPEWDKPSIESLIQKDMQTCPVPYSLSFCADREAQMKSCDIQDRSYLGVDLLLLNASARPICPLSNVIKSHKIES